MGIDWLIEFFQPQRTTCLGCGDAYFAQLERGLCPACARSAMRLDAVDMRSGLEHGQHLLDWACAAHAYTEPIARQVYALKYGGARRLGEEMGLVMADNARALGFAPVIVPVPLHWMRQLARGYNQAEVLSRALAGALGWEMDSSLLTRTRHTHKNARLAHARRLSNVSGAFATLRASCPGRYLLVDDVLTTGSTASQCALALKKSGASWVGIMAYARAGSIGHDALPSSHARPGSGFMEK